MKEIQLQFKSNGIQLFGMLYEPDCPPRQVNHPAYVICHPFVEEKKSAQKTLVDLARDLQQKGAFVLLFDFSGCGESEGELKDASLSSWVIETENAVSFLRENYPVSEVGLIGLRLGAFIAMKAALTQHNIASVALIEPVIHPESYLKSELRSKLMKELITNGEVSMSRNELINEVKNAKSIDFDGHEISQTFYEDLVAQPNLVDLIKTARTDLSILLINVSPNRKMSRAFTQLEKDVNAETAHINCEVVLFESFWYRTGPLDTTDFVASVSGFLEREKTMITK